MKSLRVLRVLVVEVEHLVYFGVDEVLEVLFLVHFLYVEGYATG